MKLTEKILAAIAACSVIGTIFLVPGSGIFLVLSLLCLSMVYFYFSFALFNGIRLRKIFKPESYTAISKNRIIGAVGAGLALSAGLLGLLFKYQSWPGASFNLYTGLLSLIAVSIVAFVKSRKKITEFYPGVLKRTLVVLVLILILLMLPKDAILDHKFRKYPAYLKAVKDARSDPTNEELQNRVMEEQEKMLEDQFE